MQQLILNLLFFVFQDIEDFETKTRSTVSVREGQGVVLLCGPPPHFGGTGRVGA